MPKPKFDAEAFLAGYNKMIDDFYSPQPQALSQSPLAAAFRQGIQRRELGKPTLKAPKTGA